MSKLPQPTRRRLFASAHPSRPDHGKLGVCNLEKKPQNTPNGNGNGAATASPGFNAQTFLESAGVASTIAKYGRGESIFTQGDACEHVMYVQDGGVKLSVLSKTGREAVVAMIGPGDFFGEGCLAGQPLRMGSATALTPSTILLVDKEKMVGLLHQEHAMSDRFISHMLARNIRIEEDLIDQLFNSSEKRLARTLLLLARYGKQDKPTRVVPKISQETLAEMVGTTRSRVNFFLNKFKKLGFIEYRRRAPAQGQQLAVERRPARLTGPAAHGDALAIHINTRTTTSRASALDPG